MYKIIVLILYGVMSWDCAFAQNESVLTKMLPLPMNKIPQQSKERLFNQNIGAAKRISLNFQDIKVRAILQLLAEFTGINIVVSDKVTGNMTIRLNDIPWEQALDIILTTKSLSKRMIGQIMLVAPAEELIDHEKKDFNVQLDLQRLTPLDTGLLQVNYAKAADIAGLLQDKKTQLLSSRGRLGVDVRTNTIWIQDVSEQIEKIKAFVKRLDIPMKQVLIEARIVNVTKEFAKELGIRFGVSKPPHFMGHLKEVTQSTSVNTIPLADRLNVDLAAAPIVASPASIGIALAKLGDGILLDLELSALESEGRGEIISSPKLITTDQQTAIIESGEEIPYQEATSGGGTAVAFKKAVLSLKVTPQITSDSTILMDLHINQDIPSVKVFNGVPAILTKEIKTNVLVNNGQTIVLGGIYKQDKQKMFNRVPFLGELPVVSAFFKSKSTLIRNEELLIFITPRIITNNLSKARITEQKQALIQGKVLDKFGKSTRSFH